MRREVIVTAEAVSLLAPAQLYERLQDYDRWAEWSPAREVVAGPFAGPIPTRLVKTGLITAREEILESRPGEGQRYRMVSGLPMHDYEAEVRLTPVDRGTRVIWKARFSVPIWSAWFWRSAIRATLRAFTRGLARGGAEHIKL